MAHKEGFGDFCAQGVRDMAKSLGRSTEDFAMHPKVWKCRAMTPGQHGGHL